MNHIPREYFARCDCGTWSFGPAADMAAVWGECGRHQAVCAFPAEIDAIWLDPTGLILAPVVRPAMYGWGAHYG